MRANYKTRIGKNTIHDHCNVVLCCLKTECASMNGDLVKVETQREDLFIQDLLLRFVGDVDVNLFPGSGGMFAC